MRRGRDGQSTLRRERAAVNAAIGDRNVVTLHVHERQSVAHSGYLSQVRHNVVGVEFLMLQNRHKVLVRGDRCS